MLGPVFKPLFMVFPSVGFLGCIGFVIMKIILLLTMHLLSYDDKFCTICMSCMLPFVYAMFCCLW